MRPAGAAQVLVQDAPGQRVSLPEQVQAQVLRARRAQEERLRQARGPHQRGHPGGQARPGAQEHRAERLLQVRGLPSELLLETRSARDI